MKDAGKKKTPNDVWDQRGLVGGERRRGSHGKVLHIVALQRCEVMSSVNQLFEMVW